MRYSAILYKSEDGENFVAEGAEISQIGVGKCGREAVNRLMNVISEVLEEHKKDSRVELCGRHSERYRELMHHIDLRKKPSRETQKNGFVLRIYDLSHVK